MFGQTSPEHAAIIQRLTATLTSIPIGGVALYEALRKSAPGFKNNKDGWLLRKARDNAEKELGCAYECVRKIGIKRLPSEEIPGVGLSALRKIRRHANRGKKRLDRVNTNSFSQTDQRRVIGMSAMLGAVAMIADGRKASAIATVADPVKPIPPKNILEMFRTE